MNYKIICRTTTGGLPFEYDFTMASNTMAIEYAKRAAIQMASWRSLMGFDLWAMPEQRHVAYIAVKPTEIVEVKLTEPTP